MAIWYLFSLIGGLEQTDHVDVSAGYRWRKGTMALCHRAHIA